MSPRPWFNPLVLLALLVVISALLLTVTALRGRLRDARLETSNVEAELDRTRTRYVDSLRISERLAKQLEVELSHALKEGRARGASLVHLTVERDSLQRVVLEQRVRIDTTQASVAAASELVAESLGVTVAADVVLQPVRALGPVTATFTWNVVRHPILLDVALVCLPGHRAEARISGPPHLPITITGATSRPDVCYPPPRWQPFSFQPPSVLWLGAAFAGGVLVAK